MIQKHTKTPSSQAKENYHMKTLLTEKGGAIKELEQIDQNNWKYFDS